MARNQPMVQKVSVVIPVYNEAANIAALFGSLHQIFETLPVKYEMIFVDDGSTDSSLEEVKKISAHNPAVFYVELSRNFGQQFALKAGLDIAQGDCVISMDGDLQHPPQLIPKLIEQWQEGFDIVFTSRKDDAKTSFYRRNSSSFFYFLMNQFSDLGLEKGANDFRLMDRRVVDAFSRFGENDFFVRGLVKWMGFRQTTISFLSGERHSGSSKYSFRKLTALALKGITSFSTKPLLLTTYLGITFFLISLSYLPYALISYFLGYAVSGWTSLIMTVIFFGGLQLLMLGIIGFYLGKVVMQGKQRPLYLIRESNHPSIQPEANG